MYLNTVESCRLRPQGGMAECIDHILYFRESHFTGSQPGRFVRDGRGRHGGLADNRRGGLPACVVYLGYRLCPKFAYRLHDLHEAGDMVIIVYACHTEPVSPILPHTGMTQNDQTRPSLGQIRIEFFHLRSACAIRMGHSFRCCRSHQSVGNLQPPHFLRLKQY